MPESLGGLIKEGIKVKFLLHCGTNKTETMPTIVLWFFKEVSYLYENVIRFGNFTESTLACLQEVKACFWKILNKLAG